MNYNKLRVPRSGTYIMKPTASCEAAQLWGHEILPPHIVPRRGTDASRMILRMIVGPASRNQVRVGRIVYPTAALLRSLQWVSDEYVSPRDTAQYKVTYYTALIDVLLWEAAWLRRDAIASYVCLCSCKLQFIGEIIHELAVTNIGGCNSQLNNSKSQAKPRIIPNSKFTARLCRLPKQELLIRMPCRPTQYLHF